LLFADRGGVYSSIGGDGERGNFALAGFVEHETLARGCGICFAAAIFRATDAQDASARLGARQKIIVAV